MIDPSTLLPSRLGLEWSMSLRKAAACFAEQGRLFVERADGDWLEIDLPNGEAEAEVIIYFLQGSLQRIETTLSAEEVCDWFELEQGHAGELKGAEADEPSAADEPGEDLFRRAKERSWSVYVEAVGTGERALGAPSFRSDTSSSGLQDDLYIQALTAWDRDDGLFEITWGQIGDRPFTVTLTVWAPGSEGQYHYQRPSSHPRRRP